MAVQSATEQSLRRVFDSRSPEETRGVAAALAAQARPGDIYALSGDLGAGKTVFAKGFAEGLGFPWPEEVVSPTFTLLQIYEGGRLPLYHFDVYRMEDASEAEEIGMDEYLFGEGVCLVEWPSRIEGLLPAERLTEVRLERDLLRGDTFRRIVVREGANIHSRDSRSPQVVCEGAEVAAPGVTLPSMAEPLREGAQPG